MGATVRALGDGGETYRGRGDGLTLRRVQGDFLTGDTMKKFAVIVMGLLAVIYLLNPGAGIFELIPDIV